MTEEDFIELVTNEFEISIPALSSSDFVHDLDFDSVDMVNLIIYVEDLSGIEVVKDADIYPVIRTVRDAYLYLHDLTGQDPDPSSK